MKAEEFIGKHPTQAFNCRVYRFSEYTLEVIKNYQYLIGIKQEGEKKICSFEKKDRTELLCSLLSLYESFPNDLYTKINGSKPESFPDGEVEKISRWCVKYGMPMEDNEPDNHLFMLLFMCFFCLTPQICIYWAETQTSV